MNIKYLTIFLAISILVLSIGAISATEDVNDTVILKEDIQSNALTQNHVEELRSSEPTSHIIKAANSTSTTKTTTTSTTKTVKKTTVSTPDTKFLFKRDSKLKIKIKDKETNKTIKNLKISFKIKNNKKYKTYTLKTNSKGIATFSTKKLSKGYHKFIITSKNSNYKVSKKDYVFIGNLYYTTINMGKSKTLKNGDVIRTFVQKKDEQFLKGVYTDVWYSGGKNPSKASPDAKYTQLYKTKFFFKNKKTGKIVTITSKGNLIDRDGEFYRDLPHVDLMKDYTPIKAKIAYLTYK